MSSIPFDSSGVFIDGVWRACASGETLPLFNPSDGTLLAQIARGTAADIDAAVAAAQAALDGAWGALTAAERGRVLLRMSGQRAGAGRRAGAAGGAGRGQALQAGPRRRGGAGALPRVLRRRRRQGARRDHPLRQRLHRVHAARAARRHRPHRALELPDADHRPQRRRGAGHGQCLRAEARRGSLPDGAGLRAHRARGRAAGRRAERRARAGRGSRRGAVLAPRRAAPVLHRLGLGRPADPDRRCQAHDPGDAGAGRQEPADRLRRRRPGRGAALPGECRHPERGADLLGRVAHPGRAQRLRHGGRAHGRALPRACASARRWPTWTWAR